MKVFSVELLSFTHGMYEQAKHLTTPVPSPYGTRCVLYTAARTQYSTHDSPVFPSTLRFFAGKTRHMNLEMLEPVIQPNEFVTKAVFEVVGVAETRAFGNPNAYNHNRRRVRARMEVTIDLSEHFLSYVYDTPVTKTEVKLLEILEVIEQIY